jgi:hypothetical protein
MAKSCNDTDIVKFRAQLRAYIDYYRTVTGASAVIDQTSTVHLITPGKKRGVDDVYELHERNVTGLRGDRARLARMLWHCHVNMTMIPGAILRCPRNDLTFDILWDETLSDSVPSPVPVKVHYSVGDNNVHQRRATYRSGFSVDGTAHTFDVVTLHALPEQDVWPNGVLVEIDCRREKGEAA